MNQQGIVNQTAVFIYFINYIQADGIDMFLTYTDICKSERGAYYIKYQWRFMSHSVKLEGPVEEKI